MLRSVQKQTAFRVIDPPSFRAAAILLWPAAAVNAAGPVGR